MKINYIMAKGHEHELKVLCNLLFNWLRPAYMYVRPPDDDNFQPKTDLGDEISLECWILFTTN